MDAKITIAGGSAGELYDLAAWLSGERELRAAVRLVTPPPGATDLGGLADVISVAVGAGGTATVLAQSLGTWLRTRRTSVKVTVERDGQKVTVDVTGAERLLPELRRLLEPPDER